MRNIKQNKNNKYQNWFFGEINKITKPFSRQIKKNLMTPITKIKNGRANINMDNKELKSITRTLYASNLIPQISWTNS